MARGRWGFWGMLLLSGIGVLLLTGPAEGKRAPSLNSFSGTCTLKGSHTNDDPVFDRRRPVLGQAEYARSSGSCYGRVNDIRPIRFEGRPRDWFPLRLDTSSGPRIVEAQRDGTGVFRVPGYRGGIRVHWQRYGNAGVKFRSARNGLASGAVVRRNGKHLLDMQVIQTLRKR